MSTLRERLQLDYKPTQLDVKLLFRADDKRIRRRKKLARASDVQVTAQEV